MTQPAQVPPVRGRDDPLFPNALHVARREYAERVGTRLFHLTTVLLATLAVVVAFIPFLIRVVDRATVTEVALVTSDEALGQRAVGILGGVLNSATPDGGAPAFLLRLTSDEAGAAQTLESGEIDGVFVINRDAQGTLGFRFQAGDGIGEDRRQQLAIGAFAVAVLDYAANNPGEGGFRVPTVEQQTVGGPAGSQPVGAAEYASRRIVGIVIVVLIFITLVIYGMWVAAGVVSEKTSRVMELMISAASAEQLVVGKVVGIGLAGLTQAVAILVPALLALLVQDPLANALLGPGPSSAPSLAGASPGLVLAFLLYFSLGFVLYALIYAAAGSMVSRVEDLQMLALPLSLIAIVGYVQAILALSGGGAGVVRLASFVPFWSPFVMLTRIAVGRVTLLEIVVSVVAMLATIAVTYVMAVRVYAAGVLLYGQRPGLRAIAGAALGR